jgi:branched-chain amino acid transport system permease protein
VKRVALAVSLLLLALAPLLIDNSYYLNIATQVLISAIFAQGLNLLVGYGGLVSLGHAGLFGVGAYAGAFLLAGGTGQLAAAAIAIGVTLATSAVFAFLALRATGISFFMITVALGQIAWGIAYRWISLTGGDNGINVAGRPAPFGISLADTNAFYYATLVIFLLALGIVTIFIRSPLGAALMGTRDQPRRMNALGYHVWAIRFWACLCSGLLTAVSGVLFVYYTQFISPQTLALTASAEVLLMVIAGGAGTLLGPIVGATLVVVVKTVVSGFIERWNMLLGFIFVAIVIFMPEGLVPGSVRLWRLMFRGRATKTAVTEAQR